ncbi:MAG: preprotein translocase subunit SecE [Gammaproteobacteria bacterium]|nr:preprotein translocase subunit SecE [Gammaproteobacteria bacterium]
MAGKADVTAGSVDTLKLAVSAGIVGASLLAFYIFSDLPLLYRVLGIVAGVVLAAVVALTTERGRAFAGFMQDARTEVRKMVWPTRIETLQTTLVVLVVVIILALFLWLVDRGLTSLIQLVIR